MKSGSDVLSNVDYDSQKSCYERSKKRQHSPFCRWIRFWRPQARKRRWGQHIMPSPIQLKIARSQW